MTPEDRKMVCHMFRVLLLGLYLIMAGQTPNMQDTFKQAVSGERKQIYDWAYIPENNRV